MLPERVVMLKESIDRGGIRIGERKEVCKEAVIEECRRDVN